MITRPTLPPLTPAEEAAGAYITAVVQGYSGPHHLAFFKHLLATLCARFPEGEIRVLVLGVYYGRDLSFLLHLAGKLHPGRAFHFIGVDKFNDAPCADWTDEARAAGNWLAAGFGRAPTYEAARGRLDAICPQNVTVSLVESDDATWLAGCRQNFHAAYLDTAHDYATVVRQIWQVVPLLVLGGILCGDDYSDRGTWGVVKAVTEKLPEHEVYGNWIWSASLG
jgi:hypothetical protein